LVDVQEHSDLAQRRHPGLLMIELTLRAARGHAAQQAALDSWLDARRARGDERAAAVIAEGALLPLTAPPDIAVENIAAGCVCCVGYTVLRVALTRVVRRVRPEVLLLIIADDEHVQRVRTLLSSASWGVTFHTRGGADADE
jgi:hypothetical protein